MQPWTDQPAANFKIKLYLDTNILSYILDQTYSGVTSTIQILGSNPFVQLVSSRYVIFELAGIRKREHYLRKMVSLQTSAGQALNMSSLLKYRDGFSSPEVDFDTIKNDIKQSVEGEIQAIVNSHNIDYKGNAFHDELLTPTVEICLSSKISKEDCLVLISALLPVEQKPEPMISLITKDEQFSQAYNDVNLQAIYQNFSLCNPEVNHIKDIKLHDGTNVNLTNPADDIRLPRFWIEKVKEQIIEKNKSFFLGKTMSPQNPGNLPANCITFKLNENTSLMNNIIVTFISKNLDFIYNVKARVPEFWNNAPIQNYPFVSNEVRNIAFLGNDTDANANVIPISPDKIAALRDDGHLVFMHPDSLLV
jgi:hypothetical protein